MDALKKITEGMTGQESAQIIYQNDVNSLTDYIVSYLHPTEGENGTNVYTLNTAVAKIPQDIRKEGMTCTFLSEEGWRSYKYIGATIDGEDWNVTDNWVAVVTEKELSNINEEVENLQRDMGNAFTQNGFIWTFAGTKVEIVFKDNGNTSIAFPEQTVISYGNTSVICDMGISMIEVPAATKNLYLVFNISKGKVEVVTAQNQMNGTVLLGWISNEVKTAFLKCSDYTVNGKSMNPTNYLLASDIIDGLISTSVDKPLSANMGRILSTQNGMMQTLSRDKIVNVNFSSSDQSVTISLPSDLFLSYGNKRIADTATTNGQVITDPMTDLRWKFLVYDLGENIYKLVDSVNQMNNSVLVGWISQFTKTAILKCDNYTVDGVSQSFSGYIPKSDIAHNLATTDANKVLGADQAIQLATQNGMMQVLGRDRTVSIDFSDSDQSVTISLPSTLLLSYGNARIIDSATSNGQVITDPMTDNRYKYLIYNLSTSQYELVLQAAQMNNSVLVGWINQYTKTAVLLCDNYTVNGLPGTASEIAKLTYDSIPTTVIQLKKVSDGEYTKLNMTSSIDTEVKITGGRISFDPTDFRVNSVNIRKGIATDLYFRCVEPFAVIEAKGVYRLLNSSSFANSHISQNVSDFGDYLTEINLPYRSNIYGDLCNISRGMVTFSLTESTPVSPELKGNLSDLPRLLMHLRITSSKSIIEGNVADLPRKLEDIYLNTGIGSKTIGNVADLPRGLKKALFYNLVLEFTGDVKDLPPNLIEVLLFGSNFIVSGNMKDVPSNITNLQIGGLSTVSGNIADIPRNMVIFALYNSSNIYGNLSDLPSGITYFNAYNNADGQTIFGDFGDIGSKKITVFRVAGNINITFDKDFPLTPTYTSVSIIPNEQYPIDSATVDKILIALDSKAISTTGTKEITLTGSCAAPTEASQAAITSLQQKGFTVQTN